MTTTNRQRAGILVAAAIYIFTLPFLLVAAAFGVANLSAITGGAVTLYVALYASVLLMGATKLFGKDVLKAVAKRGGTVMNAMAEKKARERQDVQEDEQ